MGLRQPTRRFQLSTFNFQLSPLRRLTLLSTLTVAMILLGMGAIAQKRSLFSTLEGETALFAREMLRSGDWLVVKRNGEEFNEKPPFFYWAVAGFSWAAGTVNELTTRLPSLAGAVLVLGLFRRLAPGRDGRPLAVFAGAVFLSSPKVLWMIQVGRIDMLFSALCFAAVVSYIRYFESRPPAGGGVAPGRGAAAGYSLFFLSSALATLLKGPLGAILPFLSVGAFLVMGREWRELRRLFLGSGTLLYLAITVPLFALVIQRTDGRFYRVFFLTENLERFIGRGDIPGGTFRRQPWWEYLGYFLAGFFPWVLFFPSLLKKHLKDRRSRPPGEQLLLVYFLIVLCFFSAAAGKRSDYILPLYPAAAFLVAKFLLGEGATRRWKGILAGLAASAVAALLVLSWERWAGAGSTLLGSSWVTRLIPADKVEDVRFVAGQLLATFPFLDLGGLAIALACGWALASRERMSGALATLAAAALAILLTITVVDPFMDRAQDIRPFCRAVKDEIGEEEVYFYMWWLEDVAFYLDRNIQVKLEDDLRAALSGKARRAWFIIDERDSRKLLAEGVRFPRVISEGSPRLLPLYLVGGKWK
jgi:4-amino-4-deoxy-L-arabinose transferase-like glycosyltransferase